MQNGERFLKLIFLEFSRTQEKKKKHQKEAIWNTDSDNQKKLHNIGKEWETCSKRIKEKL